MTVTLTDVRTHLNYPNPSSASGDDSELQGFLDAAVAEAEFYVGPLSSGSVTETHFGVYADRIFLRKTPVTDVATLTIARYPSASTVEYVTADIQSDGPTGMVRLLNGTFLSGDITVVYTAGASAVPPLVRLGILDLIAHWWQRGQEGSGPGGGAISGNAYDMVDVAPGAYSGVPYSVIEKFRADQQFSI